MKAYATPKRFRIRLQILPPRPVGRSPVAAVLLALCGSHWWHAAIGRGI